MGRCAILYLNRYLDEHHYCRLPSKLEYLIYNLDVKKLRSMKKGRSVSGRMTFRHFSRVLELSFSIFESSDSAAFG